MLRRLFISLSLCLGIVLTIHFVSRAFSDELPLLWDGDQKVTISGAPGIRILWWNIHAGAENLDGPKDPFQTNLSRIIHSAVAPDVFAFTEYDHAAIGEGNLRELESEYPFYQDFPYPGSAEYGQAVYSKYPFQVSSIDPIGSRSLIILKLNVNGKEVIFSPIHIEDTWRNFKKENGSMKTVEQVFVGTHNPVWYQIVKFRAVLESRLGEKLSQKNFIMIGDFNSLKPSRGYDKIGWDLWDPIIGFTPTFPALNSDYKKIFPVQMSIDHAFVSPGTEVQGAQVLPLLGSDHYALYLIFNP